MHVGSVEIFPTGGIEPVSLAQPIPFGSTS